MWVNSPPGVRIPPSPPLHENAGSLKPAFLCPKPRLSGPSGPSNVPRPRRTIPPFSRSGSLPGRYSLPPPLGSVPLKCCCNGCKKYKDQQVKNAAWRLFECCVDHRMVIVNLRRACGSVQMRSPSDSYSLRIGSWVFVRCTHQALHLLDMHCAQQALEQPPGNLQRSSGSRTGDDPV